MSSPPLTSLVKHDLRGDILCCLDGSPQTIPAISGILEKEERIVGHHVALLASAGLVAEDGEEGGLVRFVACVDEHPSWVREAVDRRRHAKGD